MCAQAFVRGVLGNWLVCLAVYMASATTTLPGKLLAILFPITAFVAIGLEVREIETLSCARSTPHAL